MSLTRFERGAGRELDDVEAVGGVAGDLDEAPPGTLASVADQLEAWKVVYVVHTSHRGHSPELEKFRVWLPTDRELTAAELPLASAGLAALLGIDKLGPRPTVPGKTPGPIFDTVSMRPNQFYYVPSLPTGPGAVAPVTRSSNGHASLISADISLW